MKLESLTVLKLEGWSLKLEALVALEALVGKIMVKPEVWPWRLKLTDVYC